MNWVISNYAPTYIVSFKYFSDKEIWSKKAVKCIIKEKKAQTTMETEFFPWARFQLYSQQWPIPLKLMELKGV